MIHIEFGDFSNEEFFALYDKYVIKNADSLGMNEQEL
jgi:ADP-dependent phosphofructokinase/glucokinase